MEFPISCNVAGNSFRGIAEQKRYAELEPDEVLTLVRDPENRFDPNAIQVHTDDGLFIGFIPKSFAAQLAPLMDEGTKLLCTCSGRGSDLLITEDDPE